MKRKSFVLHIFFSCFLSIMLMSTVNAGIRVEYDPSTTSQHGTNVDVRNYFADINGKSVYTYCIDPGKIYGGSSEGSVKYTDNKIIRTIDPSVSTGKSADDYAFDLAATYAYQIMLENGYTSETSSNRVIGSTVFRLLEFKYMPSRSSGCASGVCDAYNLYKNNGAGLTDTSEVQAAKSIYNTVVSRIGDNPSIDTYRSMVDDGTLWAPEFKTDDTVIDGTLTKRVGDIITYSFAVTPVDPSKAPEYYKEYLENSSVVCDNKTVVCNMTDKYALGPGGVVVTITVDVSKWDHQSMGIQFKLPYCDPKSAAFNLVLLEKDGNGGSANQRMLSIMAENSCPSIPTNIINRPPPDIPIPIPDPKYDSCTCDTSTGNYVFKDKDGSEKTCDPKKEDCTNFKQTNSCPDTCAKTGAKCDNSYTNVNEWICGDLKPVDGTGEGCVDRLKSAPYNIQNPTSQQIKDQWNLECWDEPEQKQKCECDKTTRTYKYYTWSYRINGWTESATWSVDEAPPSAINSESCPGKEECDSQLKLKACSKPSSDRNYWVCGDKNPVDGSGEYCVDRLKSAPYNIQNPTSQQIEEQWNLECWDEPEQKQKCECDQTTGQYKYWEWDGSWNITHNWYEGERTPDGVNMKSCPNECKPLQPDCDNWLSECEANPDSYACTQYDKYCVNCSPTVSIPSDCADLVDKPNDSDLLNNSVHASISDINKQQTSCNDKANPVKSCVIGKEDATGESFMDQTSKVADNPYCSVWCEETYDFGLPAAINSRSGGYFTLSMEMSGTRTCYTSGSLSSATEINRTQFERDLISKQFEIINAWNDYQYNKLGAEKYSEITTETSAAIASHTCNSDTCLLPKSNGDCDEWETYESKGASEVKLYNYPSFAASQYTPTEEDGKFSISSSSKTYSGEKFGTANKYGCDDSQGTDGAEDAGKLYDDFVQKRDAALQQLNTAISDLKQMVGQYNSCSGNISNPEIDSTAWTNDMKWDPQIDFSYNENYLNSREGQFVAVDGSRIDTEKEEYCTGNTDSTYSCPGASSNVPTTTTTVKLCNTTDCYDTTYTIGTAKWVKKVRTIKEQFKPSVSFSTKVQFGTIVKKADGSSEFYTSLPDDAFPVSLITKTGVYPFTFKFSNIGQSNQNGGLGRLISTNGNDVLTAFNKLAPNLKCTGNGQLSGDQTATSQTGYVCHYVNNCPDCPFVCEDGDCSFKGCNGTCEFNCQNCIFDGTRSNYTFRSVSLYNLNPNNRDSIGYNWRNQQKGVITRQEIEALGEQVYIKPQYSYTLSPKNMSNIRKYNQAAVVYTNTVIPQGYRTAGDGDEAIYCENHDFNGKVYNINCKSRFLDMLDQDNAHDYTTGEIVRVTRDPDAWELFTDTPYCKDYSCLSDGIGPSWRLKEE